MVRGEKPVASIVLDRNRDQKFIRKADELDLSYAYGKNEWGAKILTITAVPNASLWMLLEVRNCHEKRLVSHLIEQYKRELQSLCVLDYMVPGGFDLSSSHMYSNVNMLESALLYGYPLDLAAGSLELPFSQIRTMSSREMAMPEADAKVER